MYVQFEIKGRCDDINKLVSFLDSVGDIETTIKINEVVIKCHNVEDNNILSEEKDYIRQRPTY